MCPAAGARLEQMGWEGQGGGQGAQGGRRWEDKCGTGLPSL